MTPPGSSRKASPVQARQADTLNSRKSERTRSPHVEERDLQARVTTVF